MSIAYCADCLVRIDECQCDDPRNGLIFGETMLAVARYEKKVERKIRQFPGDTLSKREIIEILKQE